MRMYTCIHDVLNVKTASSKSEATALTQFTAFFPLIFRPPFLNCHQEINFGNFQYLDIHVLLTPNTAE